MSGKTVSLQTHGDESAESLRERAQKALGAGKADSWTPLEAFLMEGHR